MIALDLPPQPAIIRPALPWEVHLSAQMERRGISRAVRRAIIAELRRIEGDRPAIIKATASDLARYGEGKGFPVGAMLLNPYRFGVSGIVVVDAKGTQSTAGETVYSSLNPGLAGSFTGCLLAVGAQGTGARTVSTLTVNGVAATYLFRTQSGNQTIEIWGIATTVCDNVEATWSGACNNCGLDVVAFVGATDPTAALDTATSTADPAALAIDVAAGGLIVASIWMTNGGAASWANATEATDRIIEGTFGMSSAYYAAAGAEASRAVSGDYTGGGSFLAGVAVAIR